MLQIDFPCWLNADILKGPGKPTARPVDPTRFFKTAKYFENSTLSIGWTTTYNFHSARSYTDSHINEMLEEIRKNNVTQPITFPVRAATAAYSENQMFKLLKSVPNSTLTVWTGPDDIVNVEKLRRIIKTAGLNRVYLDAPRDLRQLLDLDDLYAMQG